MKTKKTVIAVLTAVALISAAFIAGCTDGLTDKYAEESYYIPKGKGIVRLNIIDDSKERTILPLPALSSRVFDVVITSTTSNSANNKTLTKVSYASLTGSGANATITLNVDTYSISVTAFDSTNNPIAGWNNNSTNFSVTAGSSKGFNVELKPYTTGNGTFSFNITPSSNGATVFDIVGYPSGTSIGSSYPGYTAGTSIAFPATLSAQANTSITLVSGYYLVKVTATLTNYQTMEYIHALHIYQNMTSTMDALTVPALVKNTFTITYNLDGGDDTNDDFDDTTPSTETVKYGNFTTGINGSLAPVGSVDAFEGWYTGQSGTGTKWTLGNGAGATRVTADQTLYANWVPAGTTGTVSFTITFPIDEEADVSGSTTISRAAIYGGGTLVLTLAEPSTDSWSNIEWTVGGKVITGAHVTNSDKTLTINNSATFWESLILMLLLLKTICHIIPQQLELKLILKPIA